MLERVWFGMMRNLKKILNGFNRIKNETAEDQDSSLSFAVNWSEHLISILHKHRNDKEFVSEIIESSHKYFIESLTDQQKADVFSYLLGKSVRNK